MTRRPSPALIGAFVVLGTLLGILAVIFWGSGRLFERQYRYICYFPRSVNGLTLGAAVKYRGVSVGHVNDLLIPYSKVGADVRVAVIIGLEGRKVRKRGGDVDPTNDVITMLIQRGLRARLQSESLITGQLIVALDIVEDAPPEPIRIGREGLIEIPTLPSQTDELRDLLSDVGKKLKNADLPRLTTAATELIESATRLTNGPELRRVLVELGQASAQLRRLTETVDEKLEPAGAVLTDLHAALAPDAPLVVELQRVIGELSRAAASVRSLADFLERNPNALLVGKPQ